MPAVSIAEGGAAEEFAEQRRRGNLVGGDRLEIAQETHQPVGLGILLHVAGTSRRIGSAYCFITPARI